MLWPLWYGPGVIVKAGTLAAPATPAVAKTVMPAMRVPVTVETRCLHPMLAMSRVTAIPFH